MRTKQQKRKVESKDNRDLAPRLFVVLMLREAARQIHGQVRPRWRDDEKRLPLKVQ
jgi:hypothetical protein